MNNETVPQSSEMISVELVDNDDQPHLISFRGTNYGYRKHGDIFKMKKDHADADSRVQKVGGSRLSDIWGISKNREDDLHKHGVNSVEGLAEMSEIELQRIITVTETTARRIIAEAQKKM